MSKGMKIIIGRLANDTQVIVNGENIVHKLGLKRLRLEISPARQVTVNMECSPEEIEIDPQNLEIYIPGYTDVIRDSEGFS